MCSCPARSLQFPKSRRSRSQSWWRLLLSPAFTKGEMRSGRRTQPERSPPTPGENGFLGGLFLPRTLIPIGDNHRRGAGSRHLRTSVSRLEPEGDAVGTRQRLGRRGRRS